MARYAASARVSFSACQQRRCPVLTAFSANFQKTAAMGLLCAAHENRRPVPADASMRPRWLSSRWGFSRHGESGDRFYIASCSEPRPVPFACEPFLGFCLGCSMGVETIGEALSLGWRVVARCVRGREDGPASRSSWECTYRRELDLETLVCTRGRAFPLSRLESRLRCPRCGNGRMMVMFDPPSRAVSAK